MNLSNNGKRNTYSVLIVDRRRKGFRGASIVNGPLWINASTGSTLTNSLPDTIELIKFKTAK